MAYQFGKKSLAKLAEVKPDLSKLAHEAIKHSTVDFTVIEGLRTPERQSKLVKSGNSWTKKSKHFDGRAIDVVPHPVDWKDLEKFAEINKAFKKASEITGIKYRWGGDWNQNGSFKDEVHRGVYDGGHFELM